MSYYCPRLANYIVTIFLSDSDINNENTIIPCQNSWLYMSHDKFYYTGITVKAISLHIAVRNHGNMLSSLFIYLQQGVTRRKYRVKLFQRNNCNDF